MGLIAVRGKATLVETRPGFGVMRSPAGVSEEMPLAAFLKFGYWQHPAAKGVKYRADQLRDREGQWTDEPGGQLQLLDVEAETVQLGPFRVPLIPVAKESLDSDDMWAVAEKINDYAPERKHHYGIAEDMAYNIDDMGEDEQTFTVRDDDGNLSAVLWMGEDSDQLDGVYFLAVPPDVPGHRPGAGINLMRKALEMVRDSGKTLKGTAIVSARALYQRLGADFYSPGGFRVTPEMARSVLGGESVALVGAKAMTEEAGRKGMPWPDMEWEEVFLVEGKAWREDLHPRDNEGQFTDKLGSDLPRGAHHVRGPWHEMHVGYHHAPRSERERIAEHGLRAQAPLVPGGHQGVYVFDTPERAGEFGAEDVYEVVLPIPNVMKDPNPNYEGAYVYPSHIAASNLRLVREEGEGQEWWSEYADAEVGANWGPKREAGDTPLFEYHCLESEESCDADIWRRTHQQVTVVRRLGPEEVDVPMYRVRFEDGLEHDVFGDELLGDSSEYQRPDYEAKAYREELHPRDWRGRWTRKPGLGPRSWDGWPWSVRHGERPRERDVAPERTPEGHFVVYHGTTSDRAKAIMDQRQINPDDLGMVGINTTTSTARGYAVRKATREKTDAAVVQLVLDKDWMAEQQVTHEIGGSGHDEFVFGMGAGMADFSGVPSRGIVTARVLPEPTEAGEPASGGFRVVMRSYNNEKVVKVLKGGFESKEEAQAWITEQQELDWRFGGETENTYLSIDEPKPKPPPGGVQPDIEDGVRLNPGSGRPGLKRPAEGWKEKVTELRRVEVLNGKQLAAKYRDAVHVAGIPEYERSSREKELARWMEEEWGMTQLSSGQWGGSGQGRYLHGLRSPGPAFEEQHVRIMEAGARIDAEVNRRMREHGKIARKAEDDWRVARRAYLDSEEAYEAARWRQAIARARDAGITREEMGGTDEQIRERQRLTNRWRQFGGGRLGNTNRAARARYKAGAIEPNNTDDRLFNYYQFADFDESVEALYEARHEARGQMMHLNGIRNKAKGNRNVARRDSALEVLREIRSFGDTVLEAKVPDNHEARVSGTPSQHQAAINAVDWAAQHLPEDWIVTSNEHRVPLNVIWTDGRGSYDEDWGLVKVSGRYHQNPNWKAPLGAGTALHELVHRTEHARGTLTGAEWTFFQRRRREEVDNPNSDQERKKPLNEMIGFSEYEDHEVGVRDDYIDLYSGKDYGTFMDESHETLTMGIEDLMAGSHGFIDRDHEYRQFVFGSMALL